LALEARIASFRPWKIRPEDEPELTPAEVALAVQEQALHDARRALHRARRQATPLKSDVAAAEQLVDELWRRALEEGRRR
jgi:hypothetical protein